MEITNYIPTLNTLRNVLDIALVFIIVYVVLKLLRGTRAVPTVVGMLILALLYWLAVAQDLSTLEFVLRYAVGFIGIAIIVLTQIFTYLVPRLVGVAALAGSLASAFIALAWLSFCFQALLYGAAWVRVRDGGSGPGGSAGLERPAAAAEPGRGGQ